MRRLVFITGLVLLNVLVFSIPVSTDLTVSFLDVGQGDAVLITSPTGSQMLVDGGATRAVLRELGTSIPFFDRTLDVVVATHPDKDHVGGLSEVLRRYDVEVFLESGVFHDTSATQAVQSVLQEKSTPTVTAMRGMRILLGGGAYADVLFPDRNVSGVESNTGSIFLQIVYGNTKVLLTGDAPKSVERYVHALDGSRLQSTIFKVGHHGSKTSSDPQFVASVDPDYSIISAGKDNRYGHPHKEVLEIFEKTDSRILGTGENGTITFVSNGKTLRSSER